MKFIAQIIMLVLFFVSTLGLAQNFTVEKLNGIKMRNVGPAGMSGRVTSIDVDLNKEGAIYVGTASGGVWRSQSGGIKWEPVFDDAPLQSVGSIAINQSNADEIWVGTGEGNPRNSHNSGEGIYKTLDAGRTWRCMGLNKTNLIHRIRINPQNPNVVYAGALGSAWGNNKERGVFKTSDGGETWDKVLFLNDSTGCAELIMDPKNPNKLIAAMWEFGRKPWTFKSGGKSSGIFITYDGGVSWERVKAKDGLPKGDLGRIGLAIAPGKTNVVYALIEAKENAFYKSTDGGHKWKKVSTDKNIGNRPFYYSEIYVDPKNENRIFSLWSVVSISEDGGEDWKPLLPFKWTSGVHPDHHAMWIHPEDPNYIIEGNDGGLNISYDGGKHWRFVNNLPVAQFYHINYDMSIPYNIGGGMQDNGTWVGPSTVWQEGGIKNHHWNEVQFGDGFDLIFDPYNEQHVYSMSQGGWVTHINQKNGARRLIRPVHPKSTPLRFNWNAAIAIDPHVENGVYFGSQYVHHSADSGNHWEIISPDLTTGDSSKMQQDKSGGLTPDVTSAENYVSITTITPSELNSEVIWVGTDDGNIQLTVDGGKSWDNLAARVSGLPKGAWIAQIIASQKEEGEAFVVANDYRRNNWNPFVYHTTNFGRSWRKIVSNSEVDGYCLSLVQDPIVEDLLFLGTDRGLYFSLDKGGHWSKWTNKYPSVPTRDLKIHPRDHDLIIGTFGRSAWILDDIRFFRDLAKSNGKILHDSLNLISVTDAYLVNYKGVNDGRFGADGTFVGQTKTSGAMATIWLHPEFKTLNSDEPVADEKSKQTQKNFEKVKVIIFDTNRDTIRNYSVKLDTGMNRITWNLKTNGVRFPSRAEIKPEANKPSGQKVLPGKYMMQINFQGILDSTYFEVLPDPRIPFDRDLAEFGFNKRKVFYEDINSATTTYERIKKAKKTIKILESIYDKPQDSTHISIKKSIKAAKDSLDALEELFMRPAKTKGIQRSPNALNTILNRANNYLSNADPKSQMANIAVDQARIQIAETVKMVDAFFDLKWKELENMVKEDGLDLFRR